MPDDLIARLDAEAARSGVKPAELIRRCIDSVIPPVDPSHGELRSRIDRKGLLQVFVLDARSGRLLVEPGGGADGLFEPMAQIWVPLNLVTFGETADPIPASLLRPPVTTPMDLKLNLMAVGTDNPAGSPPVPSKCGICGEPFPSKAAKKRHARSAHSTPTGDPEATKS